jgi:hypothetical protein
MIHFLSFFFCLLLVGLHFLGGSEESLAIPLSMFRDNGDYYAGLALFALLLGIGGCLMLRMLQRQRLGDCFILVLTSILLLTVALTPSLNPFHIAVSIVLMGLLYVYYAAVLYHWKREWLWLYLSIPLLLGVALIHSYGLWQKSMILYFVASMNFQYVVLGIINPSTVPGFKPLPAKIRATTNTERPKIFLLRGEQSWPRRK